MPWLYKWVNRAYREAGQGTTSNARRHRRLASGISSSRPAFRDLAKGDGQWAWVEEEEEPWEEDWGDEWGGEWGWAWEDGWHSGSQPQQWDWHKEEEYPPLQKGRQPPLPPRPSREAAGSNQPPSFAKSPSPSPDSSSEQPKLKRGRVGPRATTQGSSPVPEGTPIVGGEVLCKKDKTKSKKKNKLCKKECEEDSSSKEELLVEENNEEKKTEKKEEKKDEETKDEEKIEEKKFLCKKVAIDWHGVLSDSDNRVSEDSLCAIEKLLAKGIEVTILSYGGHDRNKKTLAALKELRIFNELTYQFCTQKVGTYGKAAWCKHLNIGCIIDDDVAINMECFGKSIQVYTIIGWSGNHSGLEKISKGKVKASATLHDAIELFLQGH